MAEVQRGSLEYLGYGTVSPFKIDGHGDIANAGGVENLRSAVRTIVGTQKGNLPWKPGFGMDLWRMKHASNDRVLEDRAIQAVQEAFSRWEPRVEIASISANRIVAKGRLSLDVKYQIAGGPEISGAVLLSETVTL